MNEVAIFILGMIIGALAAVGSVLFGLSLLLPKQTKDTE